MRIESDQVTLQGPLKAFKRTIAGAGGRIDEDLIVRVQQGHLSTAVSESGHHGHLLFDVPCAIAPSTSGLVWNGHPDALEPLGGLPADAVQMSILETWLEIVNDLGKVRQTLQSRPHLTIEDANVRAAIADTGLVIFGQPRPAPETALATAKHAFVASHTVVARSEDGTQQQLLGLFKSFANHSPQGADASMPTASITLRCATDTAGAEVFENYGDLDAMQLLCGFGYLDTSTTVVHAAPVTVHDEALGAIRVVRRPERTAQQGFGKPGIPRFTREPGGLVITNLSFRPGGRAYLSALLQMSYQQAAVAPDAARRRAESTLDALLTHSALTFRNVSERAQRSNDPHPNVESVRIVADHQAALLQRW